jgi:hypothetical protein
MLAANHKTLARPNKRKQPSAAKNNLASPRASGTSPHPESLETRPDLPRPGGPHCARRSGGLERLEKADAVLSPGGSSGRSSRLSLPSRADCTDDAHRREAGRKSRRAHARRPTGALKRSGGSDVRRGRNNAPAAFPAGSPPDAAPDAAGARLCGHRGGYAHGN